MDKTKSPWTVPVAVDDIPETGLHIEIEAPESVRTGLASIGDLRDLPRLSAVFDVARNGAGVGELLDKGVAGDAATVAGFYSYGEISGSSFFGDPCLHNQTMTITWLAESA